jgi:hypothetical protein
LKDLYWDFELGPTGSEITRRPTLGPDIDETRVSPKTYMVIFAQTPKKVKFAVSSRRNGRQLISLSRLSIRNWTVSTVVFQRSLPSKRALIRLSGFLRNLIAQNRMGDGTLISGVSSPRHSTDAHRGGARCAQNGSALVPKNPLNQLEAVHFFPTGRDFYLFGAGQK